MKKDKRTKAELKRELKKATERIKEGKRHARGLIRAAEDAKTTRGENAAQAINIIESFKQEREQTKGSKYVRQPQLHSLKTWPADYADLDAGRAFDTRRNDRDFRTGDTVIFREYDPRHDDYTGRQIIQRVTGVVYADATHGALSEGFCILQVAA